MKKKFLLTSVVIIIFSNLFSVNATGQISNLVTPVLPPGQYYDLCHSTVIVNCSFDIGSPNPDSVIISIPKGTCLLDSTGAPMGLTIQPGSVFPFDNYVVLTGSLTNFTFKFQIDLSAIDCQFLSLGGGQATVKVDDFGISPVLNSNPFPINRPFVLFTAGNNSLMTGVTKGLSYGRDYILTPSQPANYDQFSMDINVEPEIYIYRIDIQIDSFNVHYPVTHYYPTAIACANLPGPANPAINSSPQNLINLLFSKTAPSDPAFLLPAGFGTNWTIHVTDSFYVTTVSPANDPRTNYTIYSACNSIPTAGCSTRTACSNFSNPTGEMRVNCPTPTNCVDLFSGWNGGHLRVDGYYPDSTDFYFGLHIGGAGLNDGRRFYGLQLAIDNHFFTIPSTGGIVDWNDVDIGTLYDNGNGNGVEYHPFLLHPDITSTNVTTDQFVRICLRAVADSATGGGDPDGPLGPMTNVYNDPTRSSANQYFGDLPGGERLIIHFKNVEFDTTGSGFMNCAAHLMRFIKELRVDGANMKDVDLCITDGRQIHRQTAYTTCDDTIVNWTFLGGYGGDVSGQSFNGHGQTFGGFVTGFSDNTDIVQPPAQPGQATEVQLTYIFNQTSVAGTTPWELGGPYTSCGNGNGNHGLMTTPYGQLYYAHVEIPNGFHIVDHTVSGTMDAAHIALYDVLPPYVVGQCNTYDFILTQPNATITFKVAMHACPSTLGIPCAHSTTNPQTGTSGNTDFYVEFRSQLNQSTSVGTVEPLAYYITYNCYSLTLYYHCLGLCAGANLAAGTSNFSFVRNTFGWSSMGNYFAAPTVPDLNAASPQVVLDRIYLDDDVLATSTNGVLGVSDSATCTFSNLNFEISYESPEGVPDVFVFTGGHIDFTDFDSIPNVIFGLDLDSANGPLGTQLWSATNAPPPPGGTAGWSYLTVQMNLDSIPGGTGVTYSMMDLVNGIGVPKQSVQLFYTGHYTLDCVNSAALPVNPTDGGHFYMGQIRAQFTVDNGIDTYGDTTNNGCFTGSCDPWGDAITALIIQNNVSTFITSGEWYEYYVLCGIREGLNVATIGGFPHQPDFPRTGFAPEFRPTVIYPDSFSLDISNNLYLQRAYVFWSDEDNGWDGPFHYYSYPWNIFYDLYDCTNPNRCPSLAGGGDPAHQGDPLHPGGTLHFNYDTLSRHMFVNGDATHPNPGSVLFPDVNNPYHVSWNSIFSGMRNNAFAVWKVQKEGETRQLAWVLNRDCYMNPGEPFVVNNIDFPMVFRNSRSRRNTNPISCVDTFSTAGISDTLRNGNNPINPIRLAPIGTTNNTASYNTPGNLFTFCADINTYYPNPLYGVNTVWMYCTSPQGVNVSIVSIAFANANCQPAGTGGITENANHLWYFDCASPSKLLITVRFDCILGTNCGQCYDSTQIEFHYGFHCNRCLITGLNPLVQDDLDTLHTCGQFSDTIVSFTPQVPALSLISTVNNSPVPHCTPASITIQLFTPVGTGEIRHPHLLIYCPQGQTVSLTNSANQFVYPGIYIGSYWDFNLITDTITSDTLTLTFSYFPGCSNTVANQHFSYDLIGTDGCDNGVAFPAWGQNDVVFIIAPPPPAPVIQWSGPSDLGCDSTGQYTVTISNIDSGFNGNLNVHLCFPQAAICSVSSIPVFSVNNGNGCYDWVIPVNGNTSEIISLTVQSCANTPCDTYTFTATAQLTSSCIACNLCDTCIDSSLVASSGKDVTICCCSAIAGFTTLNLQCCTYAFINLTNAPPVGYTAYYYWDFDDYNSIPFNTSTLEDPMHTFIGSGAHNVCLTVVFTNGVDSCTDTYCQIISCEDECDVDFSYVIDSVNCYIVHFTDISTPPPPGVHYIWYFGDGSTSTLQNPVHQYATNNTYTVCHVIQQYDTIAGNVQCADSICYPITIHCDTCNIVGQFSYQAFGCDSVVFTNQSHPGDSCTSLHSWTWLFGDGSSAVNVSPVSHVYSGPGPWTVCIIADGICHGECRDTFCQVICIPPNVSITGLHHGHLVLQPDSAGEDALISGLASQVNINFGNHPDFDATSWTYNGIHGDVRSFIRFNLAAIPVNATVQQATLSLFNNPASSNGNPAGEHSNISGSNASWLQRVLALWSEGTITWANQPAATAINQVAVPQSINVHQDYALNVTNHVQNMVTNPGGNFGWMLRLNTESHWRGLIFGSSDNADVTNRPMLDIRFAFPGTDTIRLGCEDTTVLTAVSCPGVTYQWQNNHVNIPVTSSTLVVTQSGTYTVIVSDTCGSDTSNAIVVIVASCDTCNIIAHFSYQAFGCDSVVFTNQSHPGDSCTSLHSWTWLFGDGSSAVDVSPVSHVYSGPGPWTVCIVADGICHGECRDTFCQVICIPPNVSITGLHHGHLVLQPDSAGEDALISGLASQVNINFGNHPDFDAMSWTYNGIHGDVRSFIRFNLAAIPVNATVQQATLSLFNNPASSNGNPAGEHSNISGSNASWLQRVLALWSESAITWANQPAATAINQVAVPQSINVHQDYALNVTNHVQNMVTNPGGNFGWMLRLNTESHWRGLIFGSSDNADATKRPMLDIRFAFPGTDTIRLCRGDTTILTAVSCPGVTYQWQNNHVNIPVTSSTLVVTQSGTYTVIVSNPCGSDTSNAITVIFENCDTCNLNAAIIYAVGHDCLHFFDDASTSNYPITSWFWTFGDGGTSTLQNPTHQYIVSNDYTVCLIVTAMSPNGTICIDTTCIRIRVNCRKECDGEAMFNPMIDKCKWIFNDASTGFNGSIVTGWYWDFGDGTYSLQQNPSHTFNTPGMYHVCLTITLVNADQVCYETYCQDFDVDCDHKDCDVKAAFTNDVLDCSVHFHDLSFSGQNTTIINWLWDFGDGTTSTLQDPVHNYALPGTYTVCLTVYGFDGKKYCWDKICRLVTAGDCDNVCDLDVNLFYSLHECNVQFVDLTVPLYNTTVTGWFWDFGDGTTSTAQNPFHTYNHPGSYTACLTVFGHSNSEHCQETKCVDIKVLDDCKPDECILLPGFIYANNQCSVFFNDTTYTGPNTTILSWSWNFGDNTAISHQQNPVHTYVTNGSYYVCLTVTATTGDQQCERTFCIKIKVDGNCQPMNCLVDASFNYVLNGCNLSLIDASSSGVATSIIDWSWDIAGMATLNGDVVSYVFGSDGTYTICLTITGIDGFGNQCTSNYCIEINVSNCIPARSVNPAPSISYVVIPNPSTGNFELRVESTVKTVLDAELANFYGQLILKKALDVTKGVNRFTFGLAEQAKGIYMLRIKNDKEYHLIKIVIQ